MLVADPLHYLLLSFTIWGGVTPGSHLPTAAALARGHVPAFLLQTAGGCVKLRRVRAPCQRRHRLRILHPIEAWRWVRPSCTLCFCQLHCSVDSEDSDHVMYDMMTNPDFITTQVSAMLRC